ncbi:MAG: hypothetical protein P1V20_21650 [Verrucomicrobiales bacterium]|nr:hypothetical protein [Verrucomicrobiales bacterium]
MKRLVNLIIISLVSCLALTAGAQEKITEKLNSLILPVMNFEDTPLSDAVAYLQQKSVELDPAREGVNIVIVEPDLRQNPVTLKLKYAPLGDVIRYTAMVAGAQMKTTNFAITITSPPEEKEASGEQDTAEIEKKMNNIVIPSVEFSDTPLTDALSFLAMKSNELDPAGKGKGGVNIVYDGDWLHDGQVGVSLRLKNIPLHEVLKFTAQIADHNLEIETNAVVISSKE